MKSLTDKRIRASKVAIAATMGVMLTVIETETETETEIVGTTKEAM